MVWACALTWLFLWLSNTVLTCEFQFTRERKRRSLKDLAAEVLGAKIQQNEHCPVRVTSYAWFLICVVMLWTLPFYYVTPAHDCLHDHFLYSYRSRTHELQCSFTTSTRKHGRKTWRNNSDSKRISSKSEARRKLLSPMGMTPMSPLFFYKD